MQVTLLATGYSSFPGPFLEDHGNVAASLEDAVNPPHGPGLKALQAGTTIHLDPFDHQGVHIHLVALFGIGHRGHHHLAHQSGAPHRQKLQQGEGLTYLLAGQQLGHQSQFSRGDAQIFGACCDLHDYFLPTFDLRSPAWPPKWRVGANSPSLCPTMFSVAYTGMNFLPLCTARVRPIKSGVMVERRDQVLITRRSWVSRALCTLASRLSCT